MIIYLTGSSNAGKSTVASLLARTLPTTIHLDVDALRHFARCLPLAEAIPFCLEDSALLTRNWVERQFNVVIDWLIGEKGYRRFHHLLSECHVPVFTFTLVPRLEVALVNRGERELTEQERQRIHWYYDRARTEPALGRRIDNSDQTPEQTVAEILSVIKQG